MRQKERKEECEMKPSPVRKLALLIAVFIMVPLFWNQSTASASSSTVTPRFVKTSIEIEGVGEVYQQDITNQIAGSTYKWSSSKKSVATVNKKGLITTVNKGTTTIKCVITYPNGKSKTLSSTVKVVIPATEVKINNATTVNGAHILRVGESFDFNRSIVPKNSSDKTFWSLNTQGIVSVDTKGIVTALKPGKVILAATAAKTEKEAAKSIVFDKVIIEVVAPTATVSTVEFTDSTVIKVVFDSPIDQKTVVGLNNKLLESIQVVPRKDAKGVEASDPGNLTAKFSADSKTLTITASKSFGGIYFISFSKDIKTIEGIALEEFSRQITYIDTIPPFITGIELDDSGMIVYIRFNEPIDITNLQASGATVIPTSGSGGTTVASGSTLAIINNKLNYVLSQDKKTINVNLNSIAPSDYGKTFSVALSGIKDMAGNSPSGYVLTTSLFTDVTPRPQARPMSVVRTSYNTLTAYFDRAVRTAGLARVNNGYIIPGVIDLNDNKKVTYTINPSDELLSGTQKVYLSNWGGFNVITTDFSANTPVEFNVNFTTPKENPLLLDYQFDQASKVLTLTYNKEVTLATNSGSFISTLETLNNDRWPNTVLSYTKVPSTDDKVIKVQVSGNMTLFGTYTFNLEQGFALDGFRNPSLVRSVIINNVNGVSNELPAPYRIHQNPLNASQIYVEFAQKLDEQTARLLTNYTIPGVVLLSAELIKNTVEAGATVLLTAAEDSITVTLTRPVNVRGVKGYNSSYGEMKEYSAMVELKDNKRPVFLDPPVYDRTSLNRIILNFNEEIQGSATFKITMVQSNGSREIGHTVTVAGNSLYIILNEVPANNSYLRIDVLGNTIKDMSGNAATLHSTMGVVATTN